MDETPKNLDAGKYRIVIKGVLDQRWSDWFDGFGITPTAENRTLLFGQVPNQGVLHGILSKIRDLGLTLLSVECIQNQNGGHKGGGKS